VSAHECVLAQLAHDYDTPYPLHRFCYQAAKQHHVEYGQARKLLTGIRTIVTNIAKGTQSPALSAIDAIKEESNIGSFSGSRSKSSIMM